MKAFPIWIIAHALFILAILGSLPFSNMPEYFHNGQYLPILEYDLCFFSMKIGLILFFISTPFLIYEEFYPQDSLLNAIMSFIFVDYHPFNYIIDEDKKEIKIVNPFHENYFISFRHFPNTIKAITKDGRKLFLKWEPSNIEYLTYVKTDGSLKREHQKKTIIFHTIYTKNNEKIDIDNIKAWKPYSFSPDDEMLWNWLLYKNNQLKVDRGW